MRQVLHIIKTGHPGDVLRMIEEGTAGSRPSLLLIQDAVGLTAGLGAPVFVLEEDLAARNGDTHHEKIGYGRMLELIMNADSVKVW